MGRISNLKSSLEIPGYFGSQGEFLPSDLIGAKIIEIGMVTNAEIENGFLIDYLPSMSKYVKRIVLASTELGMWIHGQCLLMDK